MSFLLWILFGFIVGLIARAITPGTQKMGFIATVLLGIVGSFIGGTIGNMWTSSSMTGQITTSGFAGSVFGAILLMVVIGRLRA
ncbi:MAG: GlsB/YeaQ/YmgE family stress response membrane protein [Bdellovibrionales bacterium]|nr:GlsB/YeaQ/YmgE family stress response membrane protein [Bdellovibrionales bacterium]